MNRERIEHDERFKINLNNLEIGRRIARGRMSLGIAQEDMAAEIGVSRQWLSYVENGRRPVRVSLLPKIAQRLEVSIDYLVTGQLKPR